MRLTDGQLRFSPTDLNSFLACEHLTTLQLAVARDELKKPYRHNPHAELIRRRGTSTRPRTSPGSRPRGAASPPSTSTTATGRAPPGRPGGHSQRADVVYQAALTDGTWRGFADFIERRADGGGYEVVDTKLARLAKPSTCFSSASTPSSCADPGALPRRMHVVTGTGERESFRPDDFFAYYRRLRARFLDAVERRRPTYPYPVDFCGLCDFLVALQASGGRRTTTSRSSPASRGSRSSGSRPPG